jgi:DNA recombination protein RmuC
VELRASNTQAISDLRGEVQSTGQTLAAASAALTTTLQKTLTDTASELRETDNQARAALRTELQIVLGQTQQSLSTQSNATQQRLGDLSSALVALRTQTERVSELAQGVVGLQDMLRAPKFRGEFGELLMERLLQDILPNGAFETQYSYRNGTRVDAVVHFAGQLVPIDAKFPLDAFRAAMAATDDAERKTQTRNFTQQVRKHVEAVSKYISPEDKTID